MKPVVVCLTKGVLQEFCSGLWVCTFADFQVNRVIDVLGQFLAASSLFKNKPLEMKHQHRRQLLQSHSPTNLDLMDRDKRGTNDVQSESTL